MLYYPSVMSNRKTIACLIAACLAAACALLSVRAAAVPSRWRNLDGKHYLGGEKFDVHDLDDAIVLLVRVPLRDISSIPFRDLTAIRRELKDSPYTEVISICGERVSSADYLQACKRQKKLAWKRFGAYFDFGQADGEPKDGPDATLYYVFDHTGSLVCKANDRVTLKRALQAAVRALPARDAFFGYTTPGASFAPVVKLLAEGRPTLPAYSALHKIAASKSPEASEATRLIAALDNTCAWRIARLKRRVAEEPARTLLDMDVLCKMWPRAKSDARYIAIAVEIKKLPEADKLAKLLHELDALATLEPKKPADAKPALARATALEAKLRKFAADEHVPPRLRAEADKACETAAHHAARLATE